MIELDYGTRLSPDPIKLSIGTLIKPKLRDISKVTFDTYSYYESLAKLTPKSYYNAVRKNMGGIEYWESLSLGERNNLKLFDIIVKEAELKSSYLEMFNFFFVENVVIYEDLFIVLKEGIKEISSQSNAEDVQGIITKENFNDIIFVIQQICCIEDKSNNEKLKFKNNLAKELFFKMQKAVEKQKIERKEDKNFELPNLISAVSNSHPTIDPINVWDLTVYQLMDSFNRLQTNRMLDMQATSVSVWGDKKNAFNPALWYKNQFK